MTASDTGTPLALPTLPARLRAGTEERTFVARSLRHSLRNIEALVIAIALPVMLMLLFTYVFGGALDPGGGYVDYVVPGIILLCAGYGAASTAVDVANDAAKGLMDRFRTLPIRSWAVLTGHVVASLARNMVATLVVFALALAIGFRPHADPASWLAALGLIAVYILAITYLFTAIGLTAGSAEAANGYGFVLMFLPYVSSAFVPVDTLPAWLQGIARHQPLTPVIETLRGLLTGTGVGSTGWLALAWCAAILAVAVMWSAWAFRRRAGRR